jgi:hypothetical protein
LIQFAIPDPIRPRAGNRLESLPERGGKVIDEMKNPPPGTHGEHGRPADRSNRHYHEVRPQRSAELPPNRREGDEETEDHQDGDTAHELLRGNLET